MRMSSKDRRRSVMRAAGSRQQIVDNIKQTADIRQRTAYRQHTDSRQQIADGRKHTANSRHKVPHSR
jgi:hypothetical protein